MEELLDQYKACAKELVELRNNYDAGSISEEETNKMYELNRAGANGKYSTNRFR